MYKCKDRCERINKEAVLATIVKYDGDLDKDS